MHPEYATWGTLNQTNSILANIFDILAQINANLVAFGNHKKPKPLKPYPRPGVEDKNKVGKGALPHKQLAEFFVKKRKCHGNDRNC